MARILVTGGSGFVGGLVVERLLRAGHALNLTGRRPVSAPTGDTRCFQLGEIGAQTDWRNAIEGCDAVVHLAAQVPSTDIHSDVYTEVNERGTERLVRQTLESDARLFIFVSSVFAAVGNSCLQPISEATCSQPVTPYGRSKLAAERHVELIEKSGRTGIVLRMPIVYGASARGNWRHLLRLAASGLPLPFGAINNRRTLIAGENAADAIARLFDLPIDLHKSGTYMLSDGASVSLTQVLSWLRAGMRLPPRLIRISPRVLRAGLNAVGKGQSAKSLLDNLEVDSRNFENVFNWAPVVSPRDAITRSGAEFIYGARLKHS